MGHFANVGKYFVTCDFCVYQSLVCESLRDKECVCVCHLTCSIPSLEGKVSTVQKIWTACKRYGTNVSQLKKFFFLGFEPCGLENSAGFLRDTLSKKLHHRKFDSKHLSRWKDKGWTDSMWTVWTDPENNSKVFKQDSIHLQWTQEQALVNQHYCKQTICCELRELSAQNTTTTSPHKTL